MHSYDFRIEPMTGPPRTVNAVLPDDIAAIGRAWQLAADDAAVEVWRGMERIYRRETLPHRRHLAN